MQPSINPADEPRSGSPLGGGHTGGGERVARTLEVWSRRSTRPLTEEDARQITENMTGFFGVLIEWKSSKRAAIVRQDRNAA
jgi:hypothetical protein